MSLIFSLLKAVTLQRELIILSLTAFIVACGSDEPEGYVVRFKANGTVVEFAAGGEQTASFTSDGPQYIGLIVGADGQRTLALKVYDTEEIAETVYTQFEPKDDGFAGSLIAYEDESGTEYTQGALVPDIRIRITEITSTSVSGSFGGTLKADGKPDLPISEGEFFVKRLD